MRKAHRRYSSQERVSILCRHLNSLDNRSCGFAHADIGVNVSTTRCPMRPRFLTR